MIHATEGLLQAYLDEEISGSAAADLRDHLAGCAACASELESLRRAGQLVHHSLGLISSADVPMLRARAAIAAHRQPDRFRGFARLSASGLAKAAMLLLALAGAGAAAIPGSPVRQALESALARVAQVFNGAAAPAHDPAAAPPVATEPVDAPEFVSSRMGVLPADGRVRVLLHTPSGNVDVRVLLVDDRMAHVEATTEEAVRFRTGAGRIEVAGLTAGAVTIEIPRTAHGATIEVDGLVYVYKQGQVLELSGPAGRERGDQVRFRLGT
jgi:hypothetical protein